MSHEKHTVTSRTTIAIIDGELHINDAAMPGALVYLWDKMLSNEFSPKNNITIGPPRQKRWMDEISGALSGREYYLKKTERKI